MENILTELSNIGYMCSSDTVLRYIKQLRQVLDVDIISSRGSNARYFVGNRLFEIEALKLIVDTIKAANVIEEGMSIKLIDKLKTLVSIHEAEELDSNIQSINVAKSENKRILHNINKIQEAIKKDVQISFDYLVWDKNKNLGYYLKQIQPTIKRTNKSYLEH